MFLAWIALSLAVPEPSSPVGVAFSVPAAADAPADPWWRTLDPRLDALVERAFAQGWDVAVARDRVAAADALHFQSVTALLPNLSFDGSINAQPASLRFAQLTGGTNDSVSGLFYQGSTVFSASLDLDLFGRNVLSTQAASDDRAASREELATAALGVANRVGGAWLDAALQAERVRLLEELSRANREIVEIVELRFARGEATGVDVLQQRQQLASLEAQLPMARAGRAVASQQLGLLLAAPVTDIALPSSLPDLGAPPAPPAPERLADVRPDLRAATERLEATWRRKLSAERGLLPTFRLSANAGWSFTNNAGAGALSRGPDLSGLYTQLDAAFRSIDPDFPGLTPPPTSSGSPEPEFQSWFNWGFGGSFSVPLFNGGRSIAALRSAQVAYRQATDTWQQSDATARAQVEVALANDTAQRLRLDAVREQAAAAEAAFLAARSRYVDGVGDYLTLYTNQSTLQNARLAALQAHRDAVAARIALHEALGGAWTRDLGASK